MKFLLFCIFVALTLPGLCQEESSTRPEEIPQRVHIINSQPPEDPNPSLAPQEINPEENVEDEIVQERARSTQVAADLNQTTEQLKEKIFNGPEELAKLGHKSLDAAALMDDKVVKVVQEMFKTNPLKSASRKEVVNLMMEKLQGQPGESFLRNNPKLLYAFADILRDENAMPAVIGILARKDDLKTYFMIWLTLLITGILIKRVYFKKQKKWSSSKRFFMGVALSLSITTISFSTFYYMFEKELSPAGKILIQHWRKRNLPIEI